MKKQKRIISVVFVLLIGMVFPISSKNTCRDILKEVYYLPFSVRTYLPITIESIQKEKYHITTKKSCKKNLALKNMIMPNGEGKFDSSMVRAKLIFTANTYYIDEKGCVIDSSGIVYKVDPLAFENKLKKYSKYGKK